MTFKKLSAEAIIRILRAYIRYSPIGFGKATLYRNLVVPYLEWRQHTSVVRTLSGYKMNVRLPDQIQSRIYFFGVWEPHVTAFVRQRLLPGDTFIDVGANVGYYSLLAASLVGERGIVCAIEASPSIFSALQKNIAQNAYTNIIAFNEAASDSEGSLDIFLAPDSNIGATTTVAIEATRKGHKKEARVRARTLDAIVGCETLLSARLIKMDVEGAELAVVSGIKDLLPSFSDRTECVFEVTPRALEAQGSTVAALLDCFTQSGYKLYRILNSYEDDEYLELPKDLQMSELRKVPATPIDLIASKLSNFS